MIHPFSVKGYELLTDEICFFLNYFEGLIPNNTPIVMEINCKGLTDEEQKLIDDTVWAHFCLILMKADLELKACLKRIGAYLLFMLLSSYG